MKSELKENQEGLKALLPEEVRNSKELSNGAKIVLGNIVKWYGTEYAKEHGSFYRSNSDMVKDTGLSEKTIINSILALEQRGLISTSRGQRGKASTYALHLDVLNSYTSKRKQNINYSTNYSNNYSNKVDNDESEMLSQNSSIVGLKSLTKDLKDCIEGLKAAILGITVNRNYSTDIDIEKDKEKNNIIIVPIIIHTVESDKVNNEANPSETENTTLAETSNTNVNTAIMEDIASSERNNVNEFPARIGDIASSEEDVEVVPSEMGYVALSEEDVFNVKPARIDDGLSDEPFTYCPVDGLEGDAEIVGCQYGNSSSFDKWNAEITEAFQRLESDMNRYFKSKKEEECRQLGIQIEESFRWCKDNRGKFTDKQINKVNVQLRRWEKQKAAKVKYFSKYKDKNALHSSVQEYHDSPVGFPSEQLSCEAERNLPPTPIHEAPRVTDAENDPNWGDKFFDVLQKNRNTTFEKFPLNEETLRFEDMNDKERKYFNSPASDLSPRNYIKRYIKAYGWLRTPKDIDRLFDTFNESVIAQFGRGSREQAEYYKFWDKSCESRYYEETEGVYETDEFELNEETLRFEDMKENVAKTFRNLINDTDMNAYGKFMFYTDAYSWLRYKRDAKKLANLYKKSVMEKFENDLENQRKWLDYWNEHCKEPRYRFSA